MADRTGPNRVRISRNRVVTIVAVLAALGGVATWIDGALDSLDQRTDGVAQALDRRIDGLEERLTRVETLLEVIRDELLGRAESSPANAD